MPDPARRVAIVGLGYVGLPLSVAFARHLEVVGYDRDAERVARLARDGTQIGALQ